MAWLPSVVNKQLECVQFNKDGGMLLAASGLTNRYWLGSLCYYKDAALAPDLEACVAGVELDSGVRDACWLPGTNAVLSGCDLGDVTLWRLSDSCQGFDLICRSVQHDSFVTAVSINADQTKASSASQDCRIKIWDIEEFVCMHTYTAHTDVVWTAAWNLTQPDTFVSCSKDGQTILWDIRKEKPAMLLNLGLASLPTCASWQPGRESTLAVGTQAGHVCLRDTRKPAAGDADTRPHGRPTHRLAFHTDRSDWLASISEDCTVVVTDFSESSPKIICRDTSHVDFVQGVAWRPNTDELFTCGWDHRVCHRLVSPPSDVIMNGDITAMELNGAGDEVAMKVSVADGALYSDKVKE